MKIVLPQSKQAKKARKLLKDILKFIVAIPLVGVLIFLIILAIKLFSTLPENTQNIIFGISVGLFGFILFFAFGFIFLMLIYDGFFSNDEDNING